MGWEYDYYNIPHSVCFDVNVFLSKNIFNEIIFFASPLKMLLGVWLVWTISDSEKQPATFGNSLVIVSRKLLRPAVDLTNFAVAKNGRRERERVCATRRLMVFFKKDFSSFHSQLNMFFGLTTILKKRFLKNILHWYKQNLKLGKFALNHCRGLTWSIVKINTWKFEIVTLNATNKSSINLFVLSLLRFIFNLIFELSRLLLTKINHFMV